MSESAKSGFAGKATKGFVLNIVITAAIMGLGHLIFYTFG
ncbi:hypothetical protein R50073_29200 [Maricurvus nonylphenolicus]